MKEILVNKNEHDKKIELMEKDNEISNLKQGLIKQDNLIQELKFKGRYKKIFYEEVLNNIS